jgi:hypothetical protein
MFRFTIRDVAWLTVVVAFAVLWQMEIRERYREHSRDLRSELADTRLELARAQSTTSIQRNYTLSLQERLDEISKVSDAAALVGEIASLKKQIESQKRLNEFYQRALELRKVSAAPLR